MRYEQIPGLDKPVSKLIFGALTAHGSYAKAQVMFDHWMEVGGNTFDTGAVYGPCDKVFGQWLQSRGVRDQIVIVAKGMHPPLDKPEQLSPQLDKILEHFGCDSTDIYIMHRDYPDVPVGEFIDVLDEEVKRGRIQVFGGSNWSIDRFLEANEYARKHNKQGMTILNNNLSLAEMIDPVWPRCIHVSDTESRRRMAEHGIVHFAWSSQARGFFTDRVDRALANPGVDQELERCWMSEANLRRRERAYELAAQKGVHPINIAAAFVLGQPFPSFALIGPETVWEMDDCLRGLDVQLTADEITWLACED
jgi:aryl-alcohol dehydrogenase-like predicted oxidoreductase